MSAASRMIITNGRILTMTPGCAERAGDILVEDGLIKAIEPKIEIEGVERLDANRGIVLPGFVETHRHLWHTPIRSLVTDWSLFEYFCHIRMTASAYYAPEDLYYAYLGGALDALNAGTTTMIEHSHIIKSSEHADEALRGLQDSGIRAIWCYGLFVYPIGHAPLRMPADTSWRYRDVRRMRREKLSSDDGHIMMGLAPAEVENFPFEEMVGEIKLGRELGLKRISCHVAQGPYSPGIHFVEQMGDAGLLGDDLLFVHGNSFTDRELRLLRESGAGVSSTAETEMQMGIGFPIVRRALDAGVRISLGADSVAICAGDMFGQMRLMLQSTRCLDNKELERQGKFPHKLALQTMDTLRMATAGGAEVAGLLHKVGTLEPGKQADIIVIRTDTPGMTPATNAAASVVGYANPGEVDTVMVAGRMVKRNGRLVSTEWANVARNLERSRDRIMAAHDRVDQAPIIREAAKMFGLESIVEEVLSQKVR